MEWRNTNFVPLELVVELKMPDPSVSGSRGTVSAGRPLTLSSACQIPRCVMMESFRVGLGAGYTRPHEAGVSLRADSV